MKMNEMISHGARLKDMPSEWFAIPSDESMKKGMVAAIGVFACNRMVDEGRLADAEVTIKHLTGIKSGMAGVHRALLRYDAMFLELMGENRPAVVGGMLSEADKKIIQSMKSYPAVIRTDYALALLGERNAEKAQSVLQRFEECASRHPYDGDIESERELIAAVQNKAINAN